MNLRILHGDDNENYLRAFGRRFLEDYDVDNVSTSNALIEMAKNHQYHLIITDNDYNDGKENGGMYAIKTIRTFDSKTPILMVSAVLYPAKKILALTAGATEVLDKSDLKSIDNFLEQYKPG